MMSEFPRATIRSETANSFAVDRLAHLGVDVVRTAAARQPPFAFTRLVRKRREAYQWPVFGIEDHGSAGGFGSPFCNSSIE